jgi:hypothetical protein
MFFGRFTWVVPALAGVLAACSGSPPKGPPPKPDFGAPEVPWKQKTLEERRAYMAAYVVPHMRRLFQEFDAKSYANFGCPTCHGGDMELVDYHMPNGLFGLPADDPITEAKDLDEDTANFMVTKVVPAMAELLHEPVSMKLPAAGSEEKPGEDEKADPEEKSGEDDEPEPGEESRKVEESRNAAKFAKTSKSKGASVEAERVVLSEDTGGAEAKTSPGGPPQGPGGVTCFTCHEKE